jgi:predicted RNA-binding protein with PIN domain
MAAHLLIDGYNIIRRSGAAARFGPGDLEGSRRYLLDELSRYKQEKQVRITVVFDGGGGTSITRERDRYRGVEVIYSKRGETADQVIMETIRTRPSGLVVATSDRAIIDEAKRHAVPFVTPDRLEAAIMGADTGEEAGPRTDKKGNPRKAPKSLRQARRVIRKI